MANPTGNKEDKLNPGQKNADQAFNGSSEKSSEYSQSSDASGKNPRHSDRAKALIKAEGQKALPPKGEWDTKISNPELIIKTTSGSKKWAYGLGIGGSLVGIFWLLFMSILPFKLQGLISNMTDLASSVPNYAVEKRVNYYVTRAISVRLLASADNLSEADAKLVFCKSGAIGCSLFATYSTDYFEKNLGITFEPEANGRAKLGGRATSWKVPVAIDTVNPNPAKGTFISLDSAHIDKTDITPAQRMVTRNSEMKSLIKQEVHNKTNRNQVIKRFLARRLLMKKFGVTTWRGPAKVESAVNKLAAARATLKSTLIEKTLGRISPRIASYLTCLQGDTAVCTKLRGSLVESIPDPVNPSDDADFDPDSDSGKAAMKKYNEDLAKNSSLKNAVNGVKDIPAEGEGRSVLKKIISKKVLATVGGVGAAAGVLDLLFRAVDSVDNGALESIWYDMATQVYTNFSTEIITGFEKVRLGDLDMETLQAMTELFDGSDNSPLLQAVMGGGASSSLAFNGESVSAASGAGYTTKCPDPEGGPDKDVVLAPGEFVCPELKVVRDYSSSFTSNGEWSALAAVAHGWTTTVGRMFDLFGDLTGEALTNIPGFDELMDLAGTTAQPAIEWFIGLIFDPPLVGPETSGDGNVTALAGGISVTENALMEEGVDIDGSAMGGGGTVLSDNALAAISQQYTDDKISEYNSMPLLAKIFDVNLSGSFANSILARLPTSLFGVLSLPSNSLASLTNTRGVDAATNFNLLKSFGMPIYGYAPNDPALTADPSSYTAESCAKSAKDREESFYRGEGDLIAVYHKSDGCALEKMAVGSELIANGVTDDPNSFASLRDINTSSTTSGATTGPVGNIYDSSVDIICADGAPDLKTADGYHKGKQAPIRLCAIPGTYLTLGSSSDKRGQTNIVVNSRVSGMWLSIINDMKKELGKSVINFTSSFRSNSTQISLYNAYVKGRGNPAAEPGTSNHQMGLALDFVMDNNRNSASLCKYVNNICTPNINDPVYNWLVANSSKYGIQQYSKEYWHWEPKG